jgi:adenosylcobinamide-GDP ribazoletransferase
MMLGSFVSALVESETGIGIERMLIFAALLLGIGAAVAVAFLGFGPGLVALLAAGSIGLVAFRLARTRIGGYTGDVLGAIEQLGEIAVLLAAAALL